MSMSMIIATNVAAKTAHRAITNTSQGQEQAARRLASGVRVASAADDVAGLAISEGMHAQVRSIDQATRNSHDGIALLNVADGASSSINEMITRIRELVIYAANDTHIYNDDNPLASNRVAHQAEIDNLLAEINQTVYRTQYSSRNLIDGTLSGLSFNPSFNPAQPLWNPGAPVSINAQGFQFKLTNPLAQSEGFVNQVVADELSAWSAETGVSVPNPLSQEHIESGIFSQPLARAMQIVLSNPQVPGSSPTRNLLETEAGQSLWIQSGAQVDGGVALNIGTFTTRLLGIENINVLHASGYDIQQQISALDTALSTVTAQRGRIGAVSNRLDFTIENNNTTSENLSEARSRIRDADMALESMRLTKYNFLQQAGQSMMAQANFGPEQVLQLLNNSLQ